MSPAPPRPDVRRSLLSDHEQATTTLGQAFRDDPIMSWMIGDDRDVGQRMSRFFSHVLQTELAAAHHLVDITGDGQAVAIWSEVDQWKASPAQTVKMVPAAIKTFGRRLPRALRTLTMIEKAHPREPHRHLAFIGVHPSRQGHGLGGALLTAMNDECDEQGLSAYLESSNPRNEALYARYGFESRGLIALPPGAPPMMAMWRDPR